jgi:hypothetical protein
MKTSPLFFALSLDFDVSINHQLEELSTMKFWDTGLKKYFYLFPVKNISKVCALIDPLKFENSEVLSILYHSKDNSEDAEIKAWKGKSGYTVTEFPNYYRIVSYQKKTEFSKPTRQMAEIPKERVLQVWNEIFMKLPINAYHKYSYLAPKVCRLFELERYFKENGEFQGDKFQGKRTSSDYGRYYYYVHVVLIDQGLIHRKGQFLARIKNEWSKQTEITKECDTCDGKGEYELEIDDIQGTKIITCEDCKGTGKKEDNQ